jgi:hypothetical protein
MTIAASSARGMVLVIPMPFGLHSGKHLSEGGIRLIRCLALLHSFGGCHQCRSNPANLLPYGLGFGWSCFGVLRRYYNNYEVGQCYQQGTCFIWAF